MLTRPLHGLSIPRDAVAMELGGAGEQGRRRLTPDPQGRNDTGWHVVAIGGGLTIQVRFARWRGGEPVFEAKGQHATILRLEGFSSFSAAASTAGERARGGALTAFAPALPTAAATAPLPRTTVPRPAAPPQASSHAVAGRSGLSQTLGYIGIAGTGGGQLRFGRTPHGVLAVGGASGAVYEVPAAVQAKALQASGYRGMVDGSAMPAKALARYQALIKQWVRQEHAAGRIDVPLIAPAAKGNPVQQFFGGAFQSLRDVGSDISDWGRGNGAALAAVGQNLKDAGGAVTGQQSWTQAGRRMRQRNEALEREQALNHGLNAQARNSRTLAQWTGGKTVELVGEMMVAVAAAVVGRRGGTNVKGPSSAPPPEPVVPRNPKPIPGPKDATPHARLPAPKDATPGEVRLNNTVNEMLQQRGLDKISIPRSDAQNLIHAEAKKLSASQLDNLSLTQRKQLVEQALGPAPAIPVQRPTLEKPLPQTPRGVDRPTSVPAQQPALPTPLPSTPLPKLPARIPAGGPHSPTARLQRSNSPAPHTQPVDVIEKEPPRKLALGLSLLPAPEPVLPTALTAIAVVWQETPQAKDHTAAQLAQDSGHPIQSRPPERQTSLQPAAQPRVPDLRERLPSIDPNSPAGEQAARDLNLSKLEPFEAERRLNPEPGRLFMQPPGGDVPLKGNHPASAARRGAATGAKGANLQALAEQLREKLPKAQAEQAIAVLNRFPVSRQEVLAALLQSGLDSSQATLAAALGRSIEALGTQISEINTAFGFSLREAMQSLRLGRLGRQLRERLPAAYLTEIDAALPLLSPGQSRLIEEMLALGPQADNNAHFQKKFELTERTVREYMSQLNGLFGFNLQKALAAQASPAPHLSEAEWMLLSRLSDFDHATEACADIREEYAQRLASVGHDQAVAAMGFDASQLQRLSAQLTEKLGVRTLQKAVERGLPFLVLYEEGQIRAAVGEDKFQRFIAQDRDDALALTAAKPEGEDAEDPMAAEGGADSEPVAPAANQNPVNEAARVDIPTMIELMKKKLPAALAQQAIDAIDRIPPKRLRVLAVLLERGPQATNAEIGQALGLTEGTVQTRIHDLNVALGFIGSNLRAAMRSVRLDTVGQQLKQRLPSIYHPHVEAAAPRLWPGQRLIVEELLALGPQASDNVHLQQKFKLTHQAVLDYMLAINQLFGFNLRRTLAEHNPEPLASEAQEALHQAFPAELAEMLIVRIRQASPVTRQVAIQLLLAPPLSTAAELAVEFGKAESSVHGLLQTVDKQLDWPLRSELTKAQAAALAQKLGQRLPPALALRAAEVMVRLDVASLRVIASLMALDPATGNPQTVALPRGGALRRNVQNVYNHIEREFGFDLWKALQAGRPSSNLAPMAKPLPRASGASDSEAP